MDGDLYPLKLRPLLVERIWGADRLPALHGPPAGDGRAASAGDVTAVPTPIGESWLLYDDNIVLNGRFAGQRVVDVIAALGVDLLGTDNLATYGSKLALMAKLLDAAADLSIQVHPDDAYALANEAATGHLGKAEAWYVLAAEPGASVVWGFKHTMSAGEVRAAVADGSLGDALNRVVVEPGDVIVNPAGTVHAVGAGLLLFEIQQSSDLTYRLYDYGRRDAAGELRALHVEKALDVADLRAVDPAAGLGGVPSSTHEPSATDGWRLLVATPQFTLASALVGAGARSVAGELRQLTQHGSDNGAGLSTSTTSESFDLLVAVSGSLKIEPLPHEGGAAFEPVELAVGDAALLPAALGAYRVTGSGEVLRSRVGTGRV